MRNRKGTVGVESNGGWLRLRLPRNFEKRYIYLNLADTEENRAIAESLAERKNREIFQSRIEALNF